MCERENYYKVLKLDPAVDDWETIRKRIEELTSKYNRVKTDSPKRTQREADAFKIILEGDLSNVMMKETTRRQEASARREQIREAQSKLTPYLKALKTRGNHYTKNNIEKIARDLQDLDEDYIEDQLQSFGLTLGPPELTQPPVPEIPALSHAEAESINSDLAGLPGIKSLYQFLGKGYTSRSSLQELQRGYERHKAELQKRVRGSASHKVRNAILGHVQKQLLNEDNRKRYDNYLDNQAFQELDTIIELVGGEEKLITETRITDILTSVTISGATQQAVREYIINWVNKKKGWNLFLDQKQKTGQLLMCGFCEVLAADPDQKICRSCGEPLRIDCPNPTCQASPPTQDAACSQCGCTIGDAPLVERYLRSARGYLDKREFQKARIEAGKVLQIWPDYTEARSLVSEIIEYQQQERIDRHNEIEIRKKEQEILTEQIAQKERETQAVRESNRRKLSLIRSVHNALETDLSQSASLIQQLELEFPGDNEVKKLAAEAETIKEKNRLVAEIQALCNSRLFFQARTKLNLLDFDEIPEIRKKIERACLKSQVHVRKANKLLQEDSKSAAEDEFHAVLAECADNQQAKLGLVKCNIPALPDTEVFVLNEISPADQKRKDLENRLVRVAIGFISMICLLLLIFFWYSWGDFYELQAINQLIIKGDPETAQMKLDHFVGTNTERRNQTMNYLVSSGTRYVSHGKYQLKSYPNQLPQVQKSFLIATDFYELAGRYGYFHASKARADCTYLQAGVLKRAGKLEAAAGLYKAAAGLYEKAAGEYSKNSEPAEARNCEYNKNMCQDLYEKSVRIEPPG
ncbi:zinc ribbon domain-containing protein [Gimesia maris]|uniref:J domain-containing protein n=1 Tax=Gimesia maris TaxID=122 RepID=A0ABX5YR66_9PLAN|nr:zinc ribbon domain-containing protein [Gimesia maris]EDL59216.1 ACT domain containing transcriptional regulator [Gimesia maris DSM 8797]QEG18241.1 hypothetical protein GmarT_41270 [Gimesia maris]QGQ28761.1 hypothetical protein F1729_08960 [Gimesia maris]